MLRLKETQNKGFTLIELLIVIAIIAIIAAIAFVYIDPLSRMRASRDAVRYSDIRNIDQAIQLYILDNGHAPYLQDNCGPDNSDINCHANETAGSPYSWDLLGADLVAYMDKIPRDPCGENCFSDTDNGRIFYSYNYYAPGHFVHQCNDNDGTKIFCGQYEDMDPEQAKAMYSLYADHFEVDDIGRWGHARNPFHSL